MCVVSVTGIGRVTKRGTLTLLLNIGSIVLDLPVATGKEVTSIAGKSKDLTLLVTVVDGVAGRCRLVRPDGEPRLLLGGLEGLNRVIDWGRHGDDDT